MRILVVAPPWLPVPPRGYGGTEWIVAMLADGLVARGHQVTLVCAGGSATRAERRIVFDPAPSERFADRGVEAVHAVEAYAGCERFDVVSDHSGPVGAAVAAHAGRPVVHTLHGAWTADARRLYRAIGGRLHLVAISHDQAARAPVGVPVADVVHNAVPLEQLPYRRAKEPGLLAFVGRACPEKGPEVAIEVARRLGRRLVMCCKISEPEERRYWSDVVAPQLRHVDVEVRDRASREETVAVMGRAAAVLCPIRWPEPFGLVMAEANACGTPVVAFRSGAAPEVVADGVTGRLVRPGDLDAFTAAVETVDELDPAACRAHVAARFTPERLVDGYEPILLRAAERAACHQVAAARPHRSTGDPPRAAPGPVATAAGPP